MNALSDFLLARIAEDEAAARYATTRDDVGDSDWAGWWLGHYQHYSRHDPSRVLAECAALRQIVELYGVTESEEIAVDAWAAMQGALRALALPYADHQYFQEAWR